MRKKCLFILLVIMCIGLFMPNEVFARNNSRDYGDIVDRNIVKREIYSINLDYIVDNAMDKSVYKLYDETGFFNFISSYDSDRKKVIFYENSNRSFKSYSSLYTDLTDMKYFDSEEFSEILLKYPDYGLNTYSGYGASRGTFCSLVKIVPMILENENNSNDKKIIFATIHNSFHVDDIYWVDKIHDCYASGYYEFTLTNNENFNIGNNAQRDNVSFMKNTSYNYSDKLWNELNNMKISSSEINDQIVDILSRTNDDREIYSKYSSNVNYKFKVKNGNGMDFKLHDVSNTFSFNSSYDKSSDSYSIESNNSDSDYQEGIKEFSSIIIEAVKNGNFNELSSEYKSITSKDCSSTSCEINTYIPLILEGENDSKYAKQIVLGLVDIQYRQDGGKDYYDVSLNVYNNTCEFLNNGNSLNADQSELINFSRAVVEDYSSSLMYKYSNVSVSIEEISNDNSINNLNEYCDNIPVITLRQNPKTFNNGILVLIFSMIIVVCSSLIFIKKRRVY